MELLLIGAALTGLVWLSYRYRAMRRSVWFDHAILRPEDLFAHAAELAQFHRVTSCLFSCRLTISRLRESFRRITRVYISAAGDLRGEKDVIPAAEWLLDNYYIVEEQVREIMLTVRRRLFKELPVLSNGQLRGNPRIYAVALEMIAHTDAKLDEHGLVGFINAYQEQTQLSISEIWALSLMVRIALVEKIRVNCEQISAIHKLWRLAEAYLSKTKPESIPGIIGAASRIEPAFVIHLLELLRNNPEHTPDIRDAVATELLKHDTTLEKIIHQGHQAQAALATSLGNAVTSLKNTAALDWNEIFEALCPVDKILRADPIYEDMDFESRNHYRRQIQKLARKLKVTETRIARLMMECARAAQDGVQAHCGYYLLDQGRPQLMEKLGRRLPTFSFSPRAYLLSVAALTLLLSGAAGIYVGPDRPGWAAAAGLLFLLPASEVVVSLLNHVLAHLKPPAFLPKLEFQSGVPEEAAVSVVIPALLTDAQRVRELILRLEVHYLANPDPNLFFILLGDYKDAPTPEAKGDEEIAEAARAGIFALREKYGQRFWALIRKRSFSKTQNKWMGWERKRGALVELNALLTGKKHGFSQNIGHLPKIRYVLTVDADTRLPIDMARKLAGTIAHPLNKAVLDEESNKVVRGYGMIQPRIGVSLDSGNTLFARIMGGPGGVDTYTTAISDVYQDWFGQGVFTGKGIYDLAVAQRLLADLPENSILSHDLLEGGLLRTGLATDLELVDDFPGSYNSYLQRQHRWTRGDWQLLGWLQSSVSDRWGRRNPNPLGLLTRWQIADNLRRSLIPGALLIFLAAGLTVLPGNPLFWVALFFGALILPHLFSLVDFNWPGYLHNLVTRTRFAGLTGPRAFIYQIGLNLAFLPCQAWMNGDAIARTLYRLGISRENLLEWTTAAEAEKNKGDFSRFLPVLAILSALTLVIAALSPINLGLFIPLLAVWMWAPSLAARVSAKEDASPPTLSDGDRRLLRKIARQTWYYYADLTGPETSFLPPDNYQVDPPNGIDYRTSPTNIGFYLLSALAARDFGFISTLDMSRRIRQTLDSVDSLRKWKGHLFNWYDIRDLELLRPWFISTVDSGNFIGMLIALTQGLREYRHRPLYDAGLFLGLADTLGDELQLPAKLTLGAWSDLVFDAGAKRDLDARARQLLDLFREELDALFPHTEILNNPPVFLDQEQRFSRLNGLLESVKENPSPANLALQYGKILKEIDHVLDKCTLEQQDYLLVAKDDFLHAETAAIRLDQEIQALIIRCDSLIQGADFSALYNRGRHLFSVGYSVDEEKQVDSSYDLLASEARLTSFLAIIRRHVPQKHWHKPGRAVTRINGFRALVSWAGTMFEYLMPPLLLKNYPRTLLDETVHTVIAAQRNYGQRRNVPWGVSESGYYGFDYRLNYQYRAFGIPDLGLKRGLVEDMVVSSYSTLLALPFAPRAAMANIRKLLEAGLGGQYGLYEAADYTPARVSGEGCSIVQSYMAHHQGMGFVAMANYFHNFAMVRRFHDDPSVKAGELLLQERIPLQPVLTKQIREPVLPLKRKVREDVEVVRSFGVPRALPPNCHLLSNGSYFVLLTDSGSGYSRNEHIQISRWREDSPGYSYGTFIFVKSLNNDRVWSATYAPLQEEPDFYRVRFLQDRASYFRETRNLDIRTDVVVSSEDSAEIRQVSLTNHGTKTSSLEVTSYLETVLSHQNADLAHPAFNNLFIETELIPEYNGLLASRRPRTEKESVLCALHLVTVEGEAVGSIQYETDRAKFIGRGNDISRPAALHQPLSNSVGPVLDPILSLRRQLKLGPGESAVLTFVTAQGTRAELIGLAQKYSAPGAGSRALDMAYTRGLVEKRFLKLSPKLLEASQQALGHLLFPSPAKRRFASFISQNTLGQRSLWPNGISGDNPIVLINVNDADDIGIVKEVVQAHEYWRFKGLTVDLVILNGEEGGYREPVRDLIRDTVQLSQGADLLDKPGGVYIRNVNYLAKAERMLFYAAARLILTGGSSLASQLETYVPAGPEQMEFPETEPEEPGRVEDPSSKLAFFNGYGGFSQDGSEYVIWLRERMTPAPWINTIANPDFGCTVSERGAGFTFAENSRENKLTPWSNDPVADPPGEVLYLRDEGSGTVWTVAAAPIREREPYVIRHGMGYSSFSHHSHGIQQQLTIFVPRRDPVKLSHLQLKNDTDRQRKLTLTYYIRPVLGVSEQVSQQYVITALDEKLFTLRNPYNGDFPGRVAWMAASEPIQSYTGDRTEFLGLAGSLARPAALTRARLSDTAGAGMDPCGAIQILVLLAPGEEREIVFQLGQAGDISTAREIAEKYTLQQTSRALAEIRDYWRTLAGSVSVNTPEHSLNLLLSWLAYQTIVCRLLARTGFYQNGGAFGFRDQLQDAMNMAAMAPQLARAQILLHAGHQFQEGDVQHWWHPGTNNRGVRTRFSDDLLWLPYATAEYIDKTGDIGILDEEIPFLQGKPLEEGEDERYSEAEIAEETASLYEHCLRAIKRALRFGSHGIPLMGSGDWNDGMNTVGNLGRGESIWLGWFLYAILQRFAPLCRSRGDDARTEHYLEKARDIAKALEDNGWDGRWYRRAYFDDGTPLGSAENPECSIDSLAQSWAVISGGGRRDRSEEAMAEVQSHLVKDDQGLILLFTPPFADSSLRPGYIKGYLPGVRENGGQYTHGACWVIQAMAMLGRGDDALRLFQLINPVNHTRTPMECSTYKTEPYALAADVYSVHPHTGRGGWTWYTGAAGWLYRVCVEYILGIKAQGSTLVINPCIPRGWREFSMEYRFGKTLYSILVKNPMGANAGITAVRMDGEVVDTVTLVDDGGEHRIEAVMGI